MIIANGILIFVHKLGTTGPLIWLGPTEFLKNYLLPQKCTAIFKLPVPALRFCSESLREGTSLGSSTEL